MSVSKFLYGTSSASKKLPTASNLSVAFAPFFASYGITEASFAAVMGVILEEVYHFDNREPSMQVIQVRLRETGIGPAEILAALQALEVISGVALLVRQGNNPVSRKDVTVSISDSPNSRTPMVVDSRETVGGLSKFIFRKFCRGKLVPGSFLLKRVAKSSGETTILFHDADLNTIEPGDHLIVAVTEDTENILSTITPRQIKTKPAQSPVTPFTARSSDTQSPVTPFTARSGDTGEPVPHHTHVSTMQSSESKRRRTREDEDADASPVLCVNIGGRFFPVTDDRVVSPIHMQKGDEGQGETPRKGDTH